MATTTTTLRPLTIADAPAMTAVLASRDLYTYTGGQPPTHAELAALYTRQEAGRSGDGLDEWMNWIVVARDGDSVGGHEGGVSGDEGGVSGNGGGVSGYGDGMSVSGQGGGGVGTHRDGGGRQGVKPDADADDAGIPIGYVQATRRTGSTTASIAWVIGKAWQRKGHAGAAVRLMVHELGRRGVLEVTACIHPENVASVRLAGRMGMRTTGEVVDGEVCWVGRVGGAGTRGCCLERSRR